MTVQYYRLVNNLIKKEGGLMSFLNMDNEWERSAELTARFNIGDLSADPEPLSEKEAGVLYRKITGKDL